ncbi:hypothetical protein TNCV_4654991 [Trichonephila clavipes]|nr:hypothetical protein TNCV_4654991 [Trichonephila clavipes]
MHYRIIYNPQIQAELFVDNFASNNINHERLPLDYFAQDNSLINNHFHISELNRAIKSAKNTTPVVSTTALYYNNNRKDAGHFRQRTSGLFIR